MRATVLVRPKPGILDPQGDAVRHSLGELGFAVEAASVGRLIDLDLPAENAAEARASLQLMCDQLLANRLIESYEIALEDGS